MHVLADVRCVLMAPATAVAPHAKTKVTQPDIYICV